MADQANPSMVSPDAPSDGQDAALDRVVRIGMLMDLYGGLLTERQRRYVQMHFSEDLSFGEIARTHSVSRQAIHDAVKHAEKALEGYEAKLGLMARGVTRTGGGEGLRMGGDAGASAAGGAVSREARSAVGRLRALADKLRLSGGIIYNAEGYLHEVNAIAQDLEDSLKD
jgi:predicted DNA-binding protein YlxM (UPF0122 family)